MAPDQHLHVRFDEELRVRAVHEVEGQRAAVVLAPAGLGPLEGRVRIAIALAPEHQRDASA